MSTEILKSIFSLNLQSGDNQSEYQEDIFDLPPLNNKSTSKIDYTFYNNSFDHQINKMTEDEYEDNNLYMFSGSYSSTTSILTDTTSPFYEPMSSPDIPSLGSPLDLISNKLDSDLESEICSQVKKETRGRKRKSIPKIDNIKIDNINISQPIRKSSSCDDDIITIGIYTKAERLEKIRRYKEKKRNPAKKRILYQCRKRFADIRKRVGGRFVKSQNK